MDNPLPPPKIRNGFRMVYLFRTVCKHLHHYPNKTIKISSEVFGQNLTDNYCFSHKTIALNISSLNEALRDIFLPSVKQQKSYGKTNETKHLSLDFKKKFTVFILQSSFATRMLHVNLSNKPESDPFTLRSTGLETNFSAC